MLHGSDLVLDVVTETGDEVVDGDVSLGCVVASFVDADRAVRDVVG